MTTNEKTAVGLALGLLAAAGFTYCFAPKVVTRVEGSIETYDSFQNKSRKFFARDPMGKTLVYTGVFITGLGAATVGLYGLGYLAQASKNFGTTFEVVPKLK